MLSTIFHVSSRILANTGESSFPVPIALQALQAKNNTREILSLSLDMFFKILLFKVAFILYFSITISSHFLLVGLLLQYVTLFQSRELVKYYTICQLM